MKIVRLAALVGVSILVTAMAVDTAMAQGRGSGQGQGQGQAQGRGQGQSQAQGQQRSGQSQPSQRRNRSEATEQREIRHKLRNSDVYGGEMMTAEERRQYREHLQSAVSDREWAQMREQHMNEMRARAEARGTLLAPPIYGQNMMTRQEQRDFEKRVAAAQTQAEQLRIRADHRDMIRNRAAELGLQAPPEE